MPLVKGFLKIVRRGGPGGPVDPDYGIDEGEGGGEYPDIGLPDPPPGIWPPLTPEHPWRPIPEFPERPSQGLPRPPGAGGTPEHPIAPGEPDEPLPPGTIWPPLPPGVHGKFLALVLIGATGHGAMYRYVVIDADERPVDPDYGIEEGGGGGGGAEPKAKRK